MERSRVLESASGLRPASAFVLVAGVLLAVVAKAAHVAFAEEGRQPSAVASGRSPWPEFEVVDRHGRPMALSVDCFDLTLSPRSTWRAHTPRYMVERVAALLGEPRVDALLDVALDLPPGSGGVARLVEPALLLFDGPRAERVRAWIATGAVPGAEQEGRGPIEGLWVVPSDAPGGLETLCWAPEVVLSERVRAAHLGARAARRPELWTARLLGDLAQLVDPARAPVALRGEGEAAREGLRDAIWAELLPSQHRVLRRGIDPVTAHELHRLFAAEAVSPWQMTLHEGLRRRSPVETLGEAAAALEAPRSDAFAILGSWGVLGSDAAERVARRELAALPAEEREGFDLVARVRELETVRRPRSGLELLCARELEAPYWDGLLERGSASYERRLRTLPRDRRRVWDTPVPDYYGRATDAPDVPRFVTTLDAGLQRYVHERLEEALDEHQAALALAIALEVQSGEVLAVDGVSAYPTSGFAPLRHAFTPGSTMKAVVMALALDLSLVEPKELFETFGRDGIVVRDEHGHSRRVREAEGVPEQHWLTAESGLAESVNAVLVQIGLRIPAPTFRERLVALGYGRRPEAGIGPEVPGYVPPLEHGTWSHCYTHASVSFGHELSATLWQHAAALATIARGGVSRPLRLVGALEQGEAYFELPSEPGERVLGEAACAEVRRMMAIGAETGTGRLVARSERNPEFDYLGTKTGTTEKVPDEICLHAELAHLTSAHADGSPCPSSCRARLARQRDHPRPSRPCYTSSMCAIGRVSGSEREVLVLVVVDDPRTGPKFGSEVAGPTAIALLRRAFDLPERADAVVAAAPPPGDEWFNAQELPWAEGGER